MTDYERWCKAQDNAAIAGTSIDAEYLVLLQEERRQKEESETEKPVRTVPAGTKFQANGWIRLLQVIGITAVLLLVIYLIFFC